MEGSATHLVPMAPMHQEPIVSIAPLSAVYALVQPHARVVPPPILCKTVFVFWSAAWESQ